MKKSSLMLVVILTALIWLQYIPYSKGASNWDQYFYTFDSVTYNTYESGSYAEALAYADTSGLARLYVYATSTCPLPPARAKAWAQFEKRVKGNYTWVRPIVVFHADGFEASGSTKIIKLKVIDSKTGDIKGEWSKTLKTNIGNYEDELVGDWFIALGDRTYVYVITVVLDTAVWSLIASQVHIIDFYHENHRVFINCLHLEISEITPELLTG